jgi:exonuclease III
MLLLKLSIGNATLTVGSIYGPNNDDENFFDQINAVISRFNSDFVIIGGDWNATYDTRNNRHNIDTFNTVGIPSVRRSLWLNQLCARHSLKDPYRYLYPEVKEFTYIPYAVEATNRSRLDFFLISERILPLCVNCRIPNNLSSLLFDHKSVTLIFRRNNPYKKQY